MKKNIKIFITLSLLASNIAAGDHSNKTFLAARPTNANLAMEYTVWNQLVKKHEKYKAGSNISISRFYQASQNEGDVGKYFGIKNKNVIQLINDGTRDINSRFIIHERAAAAPATSATIKLEPEQEIYGVRFNFYQDLNELFQGFYFKASLPFVSVKNDMNISLPDANSDATRRATKNYFEGKYFVGAGDADAQNALTSAKIADAQSATGLADLDLTFGFKFFNNKDKYISLAINGIIPLGNTVEGDHLFEPIYGNGGHFALGASSEGEFKFWEKGDRYFKVSAAIDYRYLFSGTEKRTIGLKDSAGNKIDFGHYYLIGKVGDDTATPAANLLTRCLKVTPGHQVEAILDLAYKNGGFTFDVGYNFYWKDGEDVSMKDAWKDGEYAVVAVNKNFEAVLADAADNFALANLTVAGAADNFAAAFQINNDKFDFDTVTNPSYLTHKIYGGVGYIFENWTNHILLGVGVSYEFASDNNELENWSAWCKAGFNF